MVLGEPIPVITPAFGVLSQVKRAAEGLGRVAAFDDRGEVEHGEWDHFRNIDGPIAEPAGPVAGLASCTFGCMSPTALGIANIVIGVAYVVATVAAVISAPIIAQRLGDKRRDERERQRRRDEDFRTLLATRGALLNPDHVAALNVVPLDFDGQTPADRAVIDACKEYFASLNVESVDQARSDALLDALLDRIATALGHNLDLSDPKTRWYSPRYFRLEEEHRFRLRHAFEAVYEGRAAIPVTLVPMDQGARATNGDDRASSASVVDSAHGRAGDVESVPPSAPPRVPLAPVADIPADLKND
jgi:hypothetical protein